MSTQRATLSDFCTQRTAADRRRERKQAMLQEGAVYGRGAAAEHDSPTTTNSCLTCGRAIPRDVAKVLGDNDGCVEGCDECLIGPGNEPYSGIGRAVRRYRAGYAQRKQHVGGDD